MGTKTTYWKPVLLISIFIFFGCKKETDKVEANLIFFLNKLSETDSTVSLRLSYNSIGTLLTEGGRKTRHVTNQMLVSLIPLNTGPNNFVETVMAGYANTEVVSDHFPNYPFSFDDRGVLVPAYHTRDSTILSFTINIKKGVKYLFYATFQRPCVIYDHIESRLVLTLQQNENIFPKAVESEFATIQQLMNTSFPVLNNYEFNNPCFQITDSYSFYRDLPVKLLYYPL